MDILTQAKEMYRDEHKSASLNNEAAWGASRAHKKWDSPDPVDLTGDAPSQTNEALFGHDAQLRPMGKKRASKKQKSETTTTSGARVLKDLLHRSNSGRLCAKSIGQNVKMRPGRIRGPQKTKPPK